MFTGLIETIGKIVELQPQAGDLRLKISAPAWLERAFALGDSIAVSGVCLTLVERKGSELAFDVSTETLRCSSLALCQIGEKVNLETALTLQKPLGGHWVSGHVDGVGEVQEITEAARGQVWRISFPVELAHLIAVKGSITVEGISLTVNQVNDSSHSFSVMIVPHTLTHTTISQWQVGRRVNLEVDLLARYLHRMQSVAPVQSN